MLADVGRAAFSQISEAARNPGICSGIVSDALLPAHEAAEVYVMPRGQFNRE